MLVCVHVSINVSEYMLACVRVAARAWACVYEDKKNV